MSPTSPDSVELTGSLGEAVLPRLCARCAAPSTGFVLVEKVFTRRDDDSTQTICQALNVPFCSSCAQQHRTERPPMPIDKRILLLFRSESFWSGVGPLGFAIFLCWLGFKFLLRAEWLGVAFVGALALVFGAVAVFCWRGAWDGTHHLTIVPPSTVTEAFDYTDERQQMFEPERHVFTLRNPVFAAAFLELNQSRIWNPESRRARVAARKRSVMLKVVLVAAGLFFVYEVLDDLGLVPFK